MVKFKMTCPNCGAVVITASPECMIWELCPGCRRHIWDGCDAMMADVISPGYPDGFKGSIHPAS